MLSPLIEILPPPINLPTASPALGISFTQISRWFEPPTRIELPRFDRANKIVKLPKILESEVPESATKLWGGAYKRSVNYSVQPCDDMFRYVCDGFLHTFSTKAGDSSSSTVGSMSRIELALQSIFFERIQEIRELVYDETKTEELRESEYEVFKYYDSCINSDSPENFAASREGVRKLFGELGIDWFGDPSVNTSVYGLLKATSAYGLDLRQEILMLTPHFNRITAPLKLTTGDYYAHHFHFETQTAESFNRSRLDEIVATIWISVWSFAARANVRELLDVGAMSATLKLLGFPDLEEQTWREIVGNYKLIAALLMYLESSDGPWESCRHKVDRWELDELRKATGEDLVGILADLMGDFGVPDGATKLLACTYQVITVLKAYTDKQAMVMFHDHLGYILLADMSELVGGKVARELCSDPSCDKFDELSCLLATSKALPNTYYAIIQRLLTSDYTRIKMHYLVAIIKLAYSKVFTRQEWLDPRTKLNLVKKVAGMIDHIGSPIHLDRYDGADILTVLTPNYFENKLRVSRASLEPLHAELSRPGVRDRHHWPLHKALRVTPEVNAYHIPHLNELVAPSTMFTFPIYDETVEISHILTGSGLILAHEIGHGVEHLGTQYGPDGTPSELVDNASYEEFSTRKECLSSEFDVENPFVNGSYMSGSVVILEALSDHNAFQIVYEAWKEESAREKPTLPDVTSFAPQKLLFFGMAYGWCNALTSDMFRYVFSQSQMSHPLNSIRINRGMAHTPPFHEAFKCTMEHRLYPKKQCRMFD